MKNTTNLIRLGLAAVLLSTLNLQPSTASAQGTQFTYQGLLDSGGAPVNGASDLTFTLYNAATLGATVGTSNVFNDLPVSNGLFTVTLDFGAGAFNGAARWLEIAARPGASTGAYTNLAPRQPVTPTPYAMFAGGASAAGVSGTLPASALSGVNGGGLIGLNATNLAGTLADARLSTNVALRAGSNVFSGHQTITGGSLLRVTDGTTNGNIELQTLTGGNSGYQSINFNGDFNGGEFRYNTSKTRYRIVADHRGATDGFYIDTWDGAAQRLLFTGLPNGNVGIGTPTLVSTLDVYGSGSAGGFASPARALKVRSTASFGAAIGVDASTVAGGKEWDLFSTGGNAAEGQGRLICRNDTDNLNAMTITSNGNVGIGTTGSNRPLEVNGDAQVNGAVFIGSGHVACQTAAPLVLNSSGDFYFRRITTPGTVAPFTDIFHIAANGNVSAGGEVTCTAINLTSDRNAKEDFKPVSGRDVLAKVAALPITEWQYKTQGDSRHIGPMAQDFHAAFGTGRDDKHIASVDADGVALAAIQGLNEKLDEKSAEVESLKQSVAELKELVKQLTQPAAR